MVEIRLPSRVFMWLIFPDYTKGLKVLTKIGDLKVKVARKAVLRVPGFHSYRRTGPSRAGKPGNRNPENNGRTWRICYSKNISSPTAHHATRETSKENT